MASEKPVLIIGAGIGGLALAQGLVRSGISFRIFERDPSLGARTQGYRFRLRTPGIDALKQLVTPDMFEKLRATCGFVGPENHHFEAVTGKSEPGLIPGRGVDSSWAIDRGVLRETLMEGLTPYVEFGREVASYAVSDDGVVARFKDGSQVEGSLLVGADGLSSRIARQLIPNNFHLDTGGRWIWGKAILTEELQQKMHPDLKSGLSIVQDRVGELRFTLFLETMVFDRSDANPHRALVPERDYIYWVLQAHRDLFQEDDADLLSRKSPEAMEIVRSVTQGWDPAFKCLFANDADIPSVAVMRIATSPPDLPPWDTNARVALMGDAMHAMSPTSVSGATSAIRDAAGLHQLLKAQKQGGSGLTLEEVASYEDAVRVYAKEAITASFPVAEKLFGMKRWQDLKRI